MAQILSSWKEVAAYLGKGVRTAQRWERELGLPVRRPGEYSKGKVLVIRDELDNWVQAQALRSSPPGDSAAEVERLRKSLASATRQIRELRKEVERLRELYPAEATAPVEMEFSSSPAREQTPHSTWKRKIAI